MGVNIIRRMSRRWPCDFLGAVVGVRTADAAAALTFDDGPDPTWTPRLLQTLGRHGAKGTFFMLGQAAARYPDLVRTVAAEGHAVANHSWSHPCFADIPSRARRQEILACAEATGPHGVLLFRPPFGDQTPGSSFDTLRLGFTTVGWSLDPGDWWDSDHAALARRMGKRLKPGSIVLLHDSMTAPPVELPRAPLLDRDAMLAALDTLLLATAKQFAFVTVPELLRRGAVIRWLWLRQGASAAAAAAAAKKADARPIVRGSAD